VTRGVVSACSVIGAAHRRQAKPCQDASLSRELVSPRGERLLLLAVADGHGGSRYWLSEVGSRLACELAAAAVEAALVQHGLADPERWQPLLRQELPAAIQQQWLAAIARDWQQRPEAAGQPFSALTYGSTLGLALLAPGWWGYTGLGDWDLVHLQGGAATLVSQEQEQGGAAEATASLCLTEAARLWSERAHLVPLEAGASPFSLLLSSDGVRKSCATDADFLSLCRHLARLDNPTELAEGLGEITAAGSGDDVSVAIGHWQPVAAGGASSSPPAASRRPAPARALVIGAGLLLALAAAAVGLAQLGRRGPIATPPPIPAGQASLELEIRRLCAQPGLIAATLAQRKPQFLGVLTGELQAQALIASADRDPLGALIALSASEAEAPPAAPGPLSRSCVELRQALSQQWQLQRQASGRMPR